MKSHKPNHLQKTIISAAVATALGVGAVTTAKADIYTFDFTGLFTMLDPTGIQLQNTSYPYYGDATWGYGLRTQTSGTVQFNTATGAGSATIVPFQFFNGGAATAKGVSFQAIGDGSGGSGPYILGNMLFNWNGSDITTNIVLDGTGIFAAIQNGDAITVGAVLDTAYCTSASTCVLPASNGIKKGSYPIGLVPIATSTYNVSGSTGFGTTLGQLSLGTDDGIGGTPMDNGPFSGYNANFDFSSLTVTSFTDTTPPVVTLGSAGTPTGTTPLVLAVGGTYVDGGATCVDAAPVGGSLSVTTGGDTVDTAAGGVFNVTYTCSDTASTPNSTTSTRVVVVANPGAPLMALKGSNPETLECASVGTYSDPGAVCADYEDGPITGTDTPVTGDLFSSDAPGSVNTGVVGANTVTYSCRDSSSNTITATRTVNVVDTTKPVVTFTVGSTLNLVSSTAENPKTFTDPADAVYSDGCDSAVNTPITAAPSGTVNMTVPDTGSATVTTLLTYSATDGAGNTGTAVKTVKVTRSQPVITLPAGVLTLDVGQAYTEAGMTVDDAQDGATASTITSNTTPCFGAGTSCTIDASAVDTSTAGTYEVYYNATDSDGNKATQQVLTVTVGAFAKHSNFSMMDPNGNVFGGSNDVVFDWPDGPAVLNGDTSSLNTDQVDYTNDLKFNMTITSATPAPFYGAPWFAHHVRVFGPGTYYFETDNSKCESKLASPDTTPNGSKKTLHASAADIDVTGCPGTPGGPTTMTMTVGAGQLGVHMLFDYNGSFDIDVVNVWDTNAVWNDPDGQGVPKNNLWLGDIIDDPSGNPPDPTAPWKLVSTDANGDGINGEPMTDGPFTGFYANFNAGGTAGVLTCSAPAVLDTTKNACVLRTTAVDSTLKDNFLGATSWLTLLGMLPVFGLLRRRKKDA